MDAIVLNQNYSFKPVGSFIGYWSINLLTNEIFLSKGIKNVLGLQADTTIDFFNVLKSISPMHRLVILKMMRAAFLTRQKFEYDYPVYEESIKAPKWVQLSGELRTTGNDVVPFEFSGNLKDITATKQTNLPKEDLLTILSHELKAPLTTIKLYVQMAMDILKKSQSQSALSLLNKADIQVVEMTSIIQNILDMSLIFSGQTGLQRTYFDMNELIREVLNDLFHHVDTHLLKAKFTAAQLVFADRGKIKQVIYNLISNAIKYSPNRSDINISCHTLGSALQVSVTDQGLGISQENQKKLFNKFFRVNSENVRNTKGYGIGLYVVKEIIQHHKGNVWVESEEGAGAVFKFSLPVNYSICQ